jgi:CheY-like chemotaxis protein
MAVLVLAEDDADIRNIMVRVLRRAGHTVVEAPDGAAGLQAVREHQPDLVVSDIDMPNMSGVELAQAIRADPQTRALPVLFVSGSLTPGDRRPKLAEATAVMLKPFKARDLAACVQTLIDDGHQDGREPVVCP